MSESEESYEMATMTITIILGNTMTSWAQFWKSTSRTLCTPWECGTTPTLARTTSTGGSSMAPELLGLEVSSLDWSCLWWWCCCWWCVYFWLCSTEHWRMKIDFDYFSFRVHNCTCQDLDVTKSSNRRPIKTDNGHIKVMDPQNALFVFECT